VSYKTHKVFIRSVLTHAEYDKDKWKSDCQKSEP
jgi:mRNA-degrading endonuclease HigB of HigAB toxin-antitoxin module